MQIIFPKHPLYKRVDDEFKAEMEAARKYFDVGLVDLSDLSIQTNSSEPILYRGWMLNQLEYHTFQKVAEKRGLCLLTSTDDYLFCHYLPRNYRVIAPVTAKTMWFNTTDIDDIYPVLFGSFGGKALILKDYVKSEKHYWNEACFIKENATREEMSRIIKNFLKLRGNRFTMGLVFREFMPLKGTGEFDKGGMPISHETRWFFHKHQPMFNQMYLGEWYGELPVIDSFLPILNQVRSDFFSVDFAQTETGEWKIIELGDGQVAGLPKGTSEEAFYRALKYSE